MNELSATRDEARIVSERIRRGQPLQDLSFDLLLSPRWREASRVHWSPLSVCIRAAQMLATQAADRVLDIGSGCGKFCVVASLSTGATYYGVEQVPALVEEAQHLCELTGAQARFTTGDAFSLAWEGFNAFFAYNPFSEYRYEPDGALDESIPASAELFAQKVAQAQCRFESLPSGSRVVTYHGLGGPMPPVYRLEVAEPAGSDHLLLWVRK